jgi:hypothetical protein
MDKIKKRHYLQIEGFVTFNKNKNGQIKLNRELRVGLEVQI